jgi:hypothetical protein
MTLNAQQWADVFTLGTDLADPPEISAQHLKSLDQGGAVVKGLALLQITYLIIQLGGRHLAGLPISQLEIAVLAFSLSSIITYFLYWSRPQGVETRHIIRCKRDVSFSEWHWMLRDFEHLRPTYLWRVPRRADVPAWMANYGEVTIPNDDIFDKSKGAGDQILYFQFEATLGGVLLGGLHCLAWNFDFPTSQESLGWKICSVLTTAIPLMSALPLALWIFMMPTWLDFVDDKTHLLYCLGMFNGTVLLVPYIVARLFLLVETFRSVFFLSPEAFVETWSASFPHWG